MAEELSSAYVAIMPSLKGFSSALAKEMGKVNASPIGEKLGASLSSGFNAKIGDIGAGLTSKFTSIAKTGVAAISGIGAAVGTLAVSGGITRALNLDNAEQALTALGMDFQATMESCNEAVQGTRFGLDAAAKVAGNLGASGVASGQAMTDSLKSVAGIATITGDSLEEIGTVFAQVAAKGRLQGDELIQFSERGISAAGALADYLGKTTAEVQEMVSAGEISFQIFADAMYASFGDAAKGANNTFQGAAANIRSALSRLTAKFADPSLDGLRRVFVAAIPVIDQLSSSLDPLVDRFSALVDKGVARAESALSVFSSQLTEGASVADAAKAALEELTGVDFGSIVQGAKTIAGVIASIGLIGPALTGISKVTPVLTSAFTGIAAGASATFGAITSSAGAMVSKVSASMKSGFAGDVFGGLKSSFDAAFGDIASKASSSFSTVRYAITGAMGIAVRDVQGSAVKLAQPFAEVKTKAQTAFSGIASKLGAEVSKVSPKVAQIGTGIATSVSSGVSRSKTFLTSFAGSVGTAAKNAASRFKANFKISSFAKTQFAAASTAAKGVGSAMMGGLGALTAFSGAFMAVGAAAVAGGVDVQKWADDLNAKIAALAQNLPTMASDFAKVIPSIAQSLAAALPSIITALTTAFSAIVQVVPEVLPSVMDGVGQLVSGILSALSASAPTLMQSGMTLFMGLVNGLVAILPQFTAALPGFVSSVCGLIVANLPALIQAGVQLFTALVDSLAMVLPVLIGYLPQIIQSVSAALIENLPTLLNAGMSLFMALAQALIQVAPVLIPMIPDLVIQLIGAISAMMPQFGAAAGQLFGMLVSAVPGIAGSLLGALSDLLGKLPGAVGDFVGSMIEAGKNLIGGLVQGLKDGVGSAIEAITGVCDSVYQGVCDFFGIHSPSRLMRETFGFVVDGAVLGITDNKNQMTKGISELTGAAQKALDSAKLNANFAVGGEAYIRPYDARFDDDMGKYSPNFDLGVEKTVEKSGDQYVLNIDGVSMVAEGEIEEILMRLFAVMKREGRMTNVIV